jgi:hypothetical protein
MCTYVSLVLGAVSDLSSSFSSQARPPVNGVFTNDFRIRTNMDLVSAVDRCESLRFDHVMCNSHVPVLERSLSALLSVGGTLFIRPRKLADL